MAVKLTEQLQQVVAKFLGILSPTSSGVKWIDSRQSHFTLFFLGEQPPSVVVELSPYLKSIAANNPAFTISIGESGVFPSWKVPRVFWLGLTEGETEMIRLANQVRETCRKVADNVKLDKRPFIPHLTLGRVKASPAIMDFALFKKGVKGKMSVEEFALIESKLTFQGPIYQVLEKFELSR